MKLQCFSLVAAFLLGVSSVEAMYSIDIDMPGGSTTTVAPWCGLVGGPAYTYIIVAAVSVLQLRWYQSTVPVHVCVASGSATHACSRSSGWLAARAFCECVCTHVGTWLRPFEFSLLYYSTTAAAARGSAADGPHVQQACAECGLEQRQESVPGRQVQAMHSLGRERPLSTRSTGHSPKNLHNQVCAIALCI